MHDESFQAAIEANPEDRYSRLVYADWLEEQGDPRASLIRIEEEMRTVPVHADRYWDLKGVRNALRNQCDPEWVRRMRYGLDYHPVFRKVPDDWRGRWRLLREFVERWYGIPAGDVGGHRRVSRRVEKRLGLVLPDAVHEWIAFHADIKASWDRVFRDQYDVKHLEDLTAVSLYLQWEEDHCYAVRRENLDSDDPPVANYPLGSFQSGERRFHHRGLASGRLTSFVFQHINFRLTQGVGENCLNVRLGSKREVLKLLKTAFPVGSRFGTIRFFETTNLLAWLEKRLLLVKAPRSLTRQELPHCFQTHVPKGGHFLEMVVQWKHD